MRTAAIVASVLIDKLVACKNVETVLADVAALSAGIKSVVKQDA